MQISFHCEVQTVIIKTFTYILFNSNEIQTHNHLTVCSYHVIYACHNTAQSFGRNTQQVHTTNTAQSFGQFG